ncbi:MAG: hypothetical protein R2911_01010 [Caldilineaceae bacterium]
MQGVGPGTRANGSHVPGSVLDGLGYGTDGARETGWQTSINTLVTTGNGIVGPSNTALNDPDIAVVPEGEVITNVGYQRQPIRRFV